MASQQPELATVVMASANTEYKCRIPSGVRFMRVRNRNAVDIRYAFEPTKAGVAIEPFHTIKSGAVYETNVRGAIIGNTVAATEAGQMIYLGSATAAQVVELEFWY